MKTILFICSANVGRSQMAEGYYNTYATKSRGISAGVEDKGLKYSYKPAPEIQSVMLEDGVNISMQQVKILSEQMMGNADRVFVMCKRSEVPQHYIDLAKRIDFIEFVDPFQKEIDDIRYIRDEIKSVVIRIVKEVDGML